MTKYLAIGCAALLVLLGISGWLLKNSYEANGKLEQANTQLTKTLEDKTNATRGRATTENVVRRMPDAAKRDRLR